MLSDMHRNRASSCKEYEVESRYVGLVIGKQGAGVRELEGLPGVHQVRTYFKLVFKGSSQIWQAFLSSLLGG